MSLDGPLILSEDRLITQAALGGAGIAFQFEWHVEDAIADGLLIRLLEDWCSAIRRVPPLLSEPSSNARSIAGIRGFLQVAASLIGGLS